MTPDETTHPMRYIIIEDEQLPYRTLRRMMERLRPDYQLVGWATGVEQGETMLRGTEADLIVSDIRLTDGLCFELFDRVHTNVPVIFTTAYDEYTLRAFKLNSVDYLLKPIDEDELEAALDKLERNQLTRTADDAVRRLRQEYAGQKSAGRGRIVVERKDEYRAVEVDEVAVFASAGKYTMMYPFEGDGELLSHTMEQLEARLDGDRFFRTSRSHIVNIRAIQHVRKWLNSELRLHLDCEKVPQTCVARKRRHDFLRWYGA